MSAKDTKYFVEARHDYDAILEYAKQKGFVTTCDQHGYEESYHFHNINCVDEIIELAVSEGLFEFYEHDNRICYGLTKKGVKKFEH